MGICRECDGKTMKGKAIILLAVIALLGAGTAYCEAPNLFTYQGRLKETGLQATGNRNIEIVFCNDPSAGTCYPTPGTSVQPVYVANGLFRSTITVPSTVDLNTGDWYLELWAGGTKLTPRERLTSVPYSVYATTATALLAAPSADRIYVSTHLYITGISSAAAYYGNGATLTNVSTHTFKIGDSYGGGKIFWVDAAGKQVLIAATADQSAGIKWSNNTAVTGASQDGVYAGKANTVIISTMQHAGSYAAQVCADYTYTDPVTNEYYDDWYLPSITELQLLYTQRTAVGMPSANYYWSSNEYVPSTTLAWIVLFNNGAVSFNDKTSNTYVRCVRAGPCSGIGYSVTNAETVTDGAYTTSTQTFSGSNTFNDITLTTLTVTGDAALARRLTQAADTGITLTDADFGKTITVNSAGLQTVYLPFITAANIGATVTVIKLGAGKVAIVAFTSNFIADSTDGMKIYNDTVSPAYASITLRLAESNRWMIVSGVGKWITE